MTKRSSASHALTVHSEDPTRATCSCGGWTFESEYRAERDQIRRAFVQHAPSNLNNLEIRQLAERIQQAAAEIESCASLLDLHANTLGALSPKGLYLWGLANEGLTSAEPLQKRFAQFLSVPRDFEVEA